MSIARPFRALVLGHAGTGRTHIMVDLINSATWNKVIILTQYPQHSLYQCIKSRENILLTDDIKDVPSWDVFNHSIGKEHSLLIVDVGAFDQWKQFEQFWIRSRMHGISVAVSSHTYLEVPKLFRNNSTHMFITTLLHRERKRIAKDHELDELKDNVLIDIDGQDEALRIRSLQK